MPLPAGVEKVTITSGVPMTLPDGTWFKGRLWFTFVDLATVAEDDFTFGGGVPVDLVDGEWSVTLVANDATGISPTGGVYAVTSEFTNASDWVRYVQLLKASPSVVFSDVVVPDPVAGTYTVLADPSTLLAKAQNLADLASAGTARTNLGLGTAATQASTAFDTSGAAAAAQAAAIADAATKYVALTGDQVVSGTKTFNDAIPVAPAFDPAFDNQLTRKAYVDAAIAAAGGGSTVRTAEAFITVENIVLPTVASWTLVTSSSGTGSVPVQATIAAIAGDRVTSDLSLMRTGTGQFVDQVVDKDGSIVYYLGSRSATPLIEGNPEYYPQAGSFPATSGTVQITVTSDMLSGGILTLALAHIGSGAETLYASTTYPLYWRLANLGPEPA